MVDSVLVLFLKLRRLLLPENAKDLKVGCAIVFLPASDKDSYRLCTVCHCPRSSIECKCAHYLD